MASSLIHFKGLESVGNLTFSLFVVYSETESTNKALQRLAVSGFLKPFVFQQKKSEMTFLSWP